MHLIPLVYFYCDIFTYMFWLVYITIKKSDIKHRIIFCQHKRIFTKFL